MLPASSSGGPLVCPLILAASHNWSSSFPTPFVLSRLPHGVPKVSSLCFALFDWAGLFSLLETEEPAKETEKLIGELRKRRFFWKPVKKWFVSGRNWPRVSKLQGEVKQEKE